MTPPQVIVLLVLFGVVAMLISGRGRAEIVALAGAAVLLITGTIRPVEVEGAFASPAIIALASLFVIVYALELTGLLGLVIRSAVYLCSRMGVLGLWIIILMAGAMSAFVNNTPIVVLISPIIRDVAESMSLSAKRFLIPLSYATILGGTCTLIGTSTNLLVNDMARNAGQPVFTMFEVTPVAIVIAAAGGIYMFLFGNYLLSSASAPQEIVPNSNKAAGAAGDEPDLFPLDRPLRLFPGLISLFTFIAVILVASLNLAPIAASAFAGAVFLIATNVVAAKDAYKGLRPEVLLLIAGMVVIGLSIEVTGLASLATDFVVDGVRAVGPLAALALLYGATLLFTEILSNAAVAVLLTPVGVALAQSLSVSPRPFLVCIMMAASAAFATPFGYQTNVLVYQMGRYSYLDFVKIGVPLNFLTWIVGVIAIPRFFPF